VVERPASVVKELLENAIDAGARSIDVTVDRGGRTLIAVADDGSGMGREDAVLALARHATSKLRGAEDLGTIRTLGFRGEALPAIASVSDLALTTRPAGDRGATRVSIRYGGETEVREAARAPGTTVEIRNLFARTPARAKFLKSNATEIRWITQVFTASAMAHPDIAFTLTVDGKLSGRYPAVTDRNERIRAVLGGAVPWIPLEARVEGLGLEGLISAPDAGRSRASHVYFFVNRRWVSNRGLTRTLFSAYSSFLPKGRYPTTVVYLDLPPEAVDVNVHPTKREVRFRREGGVLAGLARSIEECLRAFRRGRFQAVPPVRHRAQSMHVGEAPAPYGAPATGQIEAPLEGDYDARAETRAGGPRLLTTLAHTYVVAQDGDDLVLIDQHAAHERILYEEAAAALAGGRAPSQSLLLPLTLDLTPEEAHTLETYRSEIHRIGFEIGPFGGRSVLIEAIPAALKRWQNGQTLRDILDEMGESARHGSDPASVVAASFACHASVRAGDVLRPEEQAGLISRLFACEEWHRCPHGRPTVVRIDRAEFERRFRRP